jgi:hypothetical protein
VISSSQRPLPDNIQHSQQTNIHTLSGMLTHIPSKGVAADARLRLRGHWDRHRLILCFRIIYYSDLSTDPVLAYVNLPEVSLTTCFQYDCSWLLKNIYLCNVFLANSEPKLLGVRINNRNSSSRVLTVALRSFPLRVTLISERIRVRPLQVVSYTCYLRPLQEQCLLKTRVCGRHSQNSEGRAQNI